MLGQLVGQDGDEDQIVDAEHDFHDHQRRQRQPGGGIGEQDEKILHGGSDHVVVAPRQFEPFLSAAKAAKPAADVIVRRAVAASSHACPSLAIVLLSVAAFASAANMRVIDPLLVQLGRQFDVTVGAASIAATAFLFANGVFVLVHGPFGDRYGKMPVVAIACIGAALCCALSALASSLGLLTLARFLTGVTSSAIIPLAIAWVGDNVALRTPPGDPRPLPDRPDARPDDGRGDWAARSATGWAGARSSGCWRRSISPPALALFAVMRARPDIARPGQRARRLDDRPDAGRAAPALGAHRDPGRGASRAACSGAPSPSSAPTCTSASAWALPPSGSRSRRSAAAVSSM